jgi:hypothetical protein
VGENALKRKETTMAFGFTLAPTTGALQLKSTAEPARPAQELTFMQSYINPSLWPRGEVTVGPAPRGEVTIGGQEQNRKECLAAGGTWDAERGLCVPQAKTSGAIDFKYAPGSTVSVGPRTDLIVDATPSSGKQNGYITPGGQSLVAAQCAAMGGVLGPDGKCYAAPTAPPAAASGGMTLPLLIGGTLVLFLLLRK